VGIDNDVGDNALTGERHVFLAISHANGTLLTVPRCLKDSIKLGVGL
jgi:hypothetical protein